MVPVPTLPSLLCRRSPSCPSLEHGSYVAEPIQLSCNGTSLWGTSYTSNRCEFGAWVAAGEHCRGWWGLASSLQCGKQRPQLGQQRRVV